MMVPMEDLLEFLDSEADTKMSHLVSPTALKAEEAVLRGAIAELLYIKHLKKRLQNNFGAP